MFNNQEDVPVLEQECKHVDSAGECSLVQKLKELQAKQRDIDSKIKSHNDGNLATFIEFLCNMEAHGFEMRREYRSYHNPGYYNSWVKRTFFDFYGFSKFEKVVEKMTDEDIDKIHEELKSFKHRASIRNELQHQSSVLKAEIKEIKDTLGIE
jgi:hypothetical protein